MEATLEHELTPIQQRAAVLLAQGLSAREVARRLDIDDHTISRWKRDPAFMAAIAAAGEAIDASIRAELAEFGADLRRAKGEALAALREILRAEDPADRLRAADILLKV